jgi:hypothetical protein
VSKRKEFYEIAMAKVRRAVYLGRGARTDRPYFLEEKDYKETSAHVVAPPGFGKSFYTEHLLREFTGCGTPASAVEPHGEFSDSYYQFLLRQPRLVRERKIIHFKPISPSNTTGFSPFDCGLEDPAEVAMVALEAFFKIWGERSFNETPRMERILYLMFLAFAANRLPLARCQEFLLAGNRSFRQNLLLAVNPRHQDMWNEIEQLPMSEKRDRFDSSLTRLARVMSTPALTRLFDGRHKSLQIPELLDRRSVLVADLSGLSTQEQSLIGTMLVNALYNAAKRRPTYRRNLSVFAIDEFPQFVTSDLARSLDQFRKFGVHLMLVHQRLDQLTPDLKSALMACAKIKIVLGGHQYEDAQLLARELFPNEVRGDRIKYRNFQTKFRPILTQKEVESFSDSESTSEGDSNNSQDSNSYGYGDSRGSTWNGDDETLHYALNSSHGSGRSSSAGHSSSYASASGHTRSYPWVTEHEEFQEESSPTCWSLDEQWHALATRIMTLDKREALVKIFNRAVLDILTPDLKQYPRLPRRRPKAGAPKSKTQAESGMPIEGTIIPPPATDDPEDFHE